MAEHPCPYKDSHDCDRMIPDTWKMETYEGFVLWKNEHNQITHRHNLENFSLVMQKYHKNNPVSSRKPKRRPEKIEVPDSDLAEALIASLREPGDEELSLEAKEQMIRVLAPVAESGGSGATQAAQAIGKVIGEIFDRMQPPGPNEKCKLCGREAKPPVIKISRALADSEFEE